MRVHGGASTETFSMPFKHEDAVTNTIIIIAHSFLFLYYIIVSKCFVFYINGFASERLILEKKR